MRGAAVVRLQSDALKRGLWLSMPAVLTLILLHILIRTQPSDYSLLSAALKVTPWRVQTFGSGALLSWTVGTFGLLFVLPFGTRRNIQHCARFAPFILLVYAQLILANNTERLLVDAFPAFLIMSLETVRRYVEPRRR